jgi:hypothetical protein
VTAVQALVILSMQFHYVTDVVAGFLAAVVATGVATVIGGWLDERFAPWTPVAFAGPTTDDRREHVSVGASITAAGGVERERVQG